MTYTGRAPRVPRAAGERVAQVVERVTFNHQVPGSSPGALTTANSNIAVSPIMNRPLRKLRRVWSESRARRMRTVSHRGNRCP